MDALRLFRIVFHVAQKNNIKIIPIPKQPFNKINQAEFIKNAEIFLIYPEAFSTNNNYNKHSEHINILSNVNCINLNNKNIDLTKSKTYFGL